MHEVPLSVQTSLWWDAAVIAVVFAAVMVSEARVLRHGSRSRPLTALLFLALAGYLCVYAWLAFLCRSPFSEPQLLLTPFWSYTEAFSAENGLHIERLGLAREILLNILVYVPLGLLLPSILPERCRRGAVTLLCGIGLSLLTEALQYITRRGYCETDDLIHNTAGTLLGLGLWMLGTLMLRRLIRRQQDSER